MLIELKCQAHLSDANDEGESCGPHSLLRSGQICAFGASDIPFHSATQSDSIGT